MVFIAVAPTSAQESRDPSSETALETCQANLYTTKLTLTMWMVDHGQYPPHTDVLIPEYLQSPLYCPLSPDKDYGYEQREEGKAFTLFCPSDHKAEGATERPSVTNDAETEKLIYDSKPE
jgi:hypothetical protein